MIWPVWIAAQASEKNTELQVLFKNRDLVIVIKKRKFALTRQENSATQVAQEEVEVWKLRMRYLDDLWRMNVRRRRNKAASRMKEIKVGGLSLVASVQFKGTT